MEVVYYNVLDQIRDAKCDAGFRGKKIKEIHLNRKEWDELQFACDLEDEGPSSFWKWRSGCVQVLGLIIVLKKNL